MCLVLILGYCRTYLLQGMNFEDINVGLYYNTVHGRLSHFVNLA